jgi:tetratricopeptide (TPR) repeat protein
VKKQSAADLQQDYLDAFELVARHATGSAPDRAVEFFLKFAAELNQQPGVEFAELRVIALLNLSRALERLQQSQQASETRQQAIAALDQIAVPGARLNIEDRLADVLLEFGEFRRAIRSCEQAIRLSRDRGAKLANRFWRAGRACVRAGLKQHAVEPLRKAVEFFGSKKGDPRLPVVLIDLGNALRTADPAEAERRYGEAAAIWEQSGAHAQATIAWVNLGIVCGQQGRLEESLEWYEKARRVRQADPATPGPRLGSLANNIAGVYRRMKNFELAAREVREAIALLEGDPRLAQAYGTYALVLRDQGDDEAALEWFRRSRAEHARQPSPNIAELSELLGNEADSLRRLGRAQEAAALEQQIAALTADVPPVETHQVTPVAKDVPAAGHEAGEVLVELDGIHHLPETVYRECDIATLENRLEEALESDEVGQLDGHETGPENTTLFLYGPDADALFRAVEPVLRDYPLCQGAMVTVRQGDRERRFVLR